MCARRLRSATSVAGLAAWPKDDSADSEPSNRESSSGGRVANARDAMPIVVKTIESSRVVKCATCTTRSYTLVVGRDTRLCLIWAQVEAAETSADGLQEVKSPFKFELFRWNER